MATQNDTALQRLLPRREAEQLLESFASFAPALGFTLICRGDVLAKAGDWPPEALALALASADDSPLVESPSVVTRADGLRTYAIARGERRLATLVARGE